jgi:hypothetical protein
MPDSGRDARRAVLPAQLPPATSTRHRLRSAVASVMGKLAAPGNHRVSPMTSPSIVCACTIGSRRSPDHPAGQVRLDRIRQRVVVGPRELQVVPLGIAGIRHEGSGVVPTASAGQQRRRDQHHRDNGWTSRRGDGNVVEEHCPHAFGKSPSPCAAERGCQGGDVGSARGGTAAVTRSEEEGSDDLSVVRLVRRFFPPEGGSYGGGSCPAA